MTAERRFVLIALAVLLLISLFQNWPVLLGRVPLAMDTIFTFPAWDMYLTPDMGTLEHPELGDIITQFFLWRVFTHRAVLHGVLPLWNPYLLCGTPFQADPLNELFNPLSVLYYLLPTVLAWTLTWLLRPLLAAAFAIWFARTIGASRAGALLTGICFGFTGFMAAWQGWPQVETGLALPFVFVATERLIRSPDLQRASVLAIACSLTFLGGHPGIAIYVFIAAGFFALYRILFPEAAATGRATGRIVLMAIAAGLMSIGLTAVQLLPTFEWVQHTHRSPTETRAGHLPASKMLAFFCRDMDLARNYAGIETPEQASYAGVVTLVLVFLALAGSRRRMAIFFVLLAIFSHQVVFGWGPGYWFASHAPGLKAFYNTRFNLILGFAIAVLAGLGLTFLQERWTTAAANTKWWWILWSVAAVACGAGVVALNAASNPAGVKAAALLERPATAAILLVISLVLCCPLVATRWKGAAAAALALAIVDIGTFGYLHTPFFPAREIFPRPPVLRALAARDRSLFRVLSIDSSLPSNAEMMFGFFSPTGYQYALARTHRLLRTVLEGEAVPTANSARLVQDRTRVLDLMNVKYLVGNTFRRSAETLASDPRFRAILRTGDVTVFENLDVLPRAFLVPAEGVITATSPDEALKRVADPEFDPARRAVVEGRFEKSASAPAADTAGQRLLIRSGINAVRVDATVAQRSLLVVSNSFFPGWRVSVDGRTRPLLLTDYAFQGVVVEPGQHTIQFRYRPRSFIAGAALSTCTLLFILANGLWVRTRRRLPLEQPSPSPIDDITSADDVRAAASPIVAERVEGTASTRTPRSWIVFAIIAAVLLALMIAVFRHFSPVPSPVVNRVDEGWKTDRVNLLVIGVPGARRINAGGDLAEAIWLVSLKPSTREAALISIPPDLVVSVDGFGSHPLRNVHQLGDSTRYEGGGPGLIIHAIEPVIGQRVHGFVRIDFAGFERLIDDIGGIDVQVDQPFRDTAAGDEFTRGWQHMSGERALRYARYRNVDGEAGTYFSREVRQQQVLTALRRKVATLDTQHILRLAAGLGSVSASTTTNLNTVQMMRLFRRFHDIAPADMHHVSLAPLAMPFTVADATGGEGMRPRSGNFAEIQASIANVFRP